MCFRFIIFFFNLQIKHDYVTRKNKRDSDYFRLRRDYFLRRESHRLRRLYSISLESSRSTFVFLRSHLASDESPPGLLSPLASDEGTPSSWVPSSRFRWGPFLTRFSSKILKKIILLTTRINRTIQETSPGVYSSILEETPSKYPLHALE